MIENISCKICDKNFNSLEAYKWHIMDFYAGNCHSYKSSLYIFYFDNCNISYIESLYTYTAKIIVVSNGKTIEIPMERIPKEINSSYYINDNFEKISYLVDLIVKVKNNVIFL